MTQLTEHFTLEELTFSSTAQRLGIDNSPSEEVRRNLFRLACGLELVRHAVDDEPVRVESAYRCFKLNRAIGGSASSAHMDGTAGDIVVAGMSPDEVIKRIRLAGIVFDQLIHEGTWTHISFDARCRGECLQAHFGPAGTTYSRLA